MPAVRAWTPNYGFQQPFNRCGYYIRHSYINHTVALPSNDYIPLNVCSNYISDSVPEASLHRGYCDVVIDAWVWGDEARSGVIGVEMFMI